MNDRLKLVSLTANEDLTKEIANILGVEVMPSVVSHFKDGEILFEGKQSFRGDNVYIIQSTCAPVTERLMEVLICCDALKRASARTITCIMPYFGYARQDRKAKARQPITAKLVADLLTTAGCQRVVCTDLHASQIQGFFNIPVDDVSALPIFYRYFKDLNLEEVSILDRTKTPAYDGTLIMARAEDGEIHFRGEDFIDEVIVKEENVQEDVKQEEVVEEPEVKEQPKQQEVVENINTIDYSKYETMIKEMKDE